MRMKPTKTQFLKIRNKQPSGINPYDLSQVGMGFNQPCPRCGLQIDRRTSPYEPIGFINYCRCKR
jgi:hypothetical protein